MSPKRVTRAGPQRYDDPKKLRDAVRAWCLLEIAERVRSASHARGEQVPLRATLADGERWWSPAQQAHLEASIRYSGEAREIAVRLLAAARDAERFLRDNEKRSEPFEDGCVRALKRLLDAPGFRLRMRDPDPHDWSPRPLLVAEWNRRGRWWWTDRMPTRRDLAILSLLAGHGRDWARERCKKDGPTVLDAVRAEERAIGMHVKRLFRSATSA